MTARRTQRPHNNQLSLLHMALPNSFTKQLAIVVGGDSVVVVVVMRELRLLSLINVVRLVGRLDLLHSLLAKVLRLVILYTNHMIIIQDIRDSSERIMRSVWHIGIPKAGIYNRALDRPQ